MREYEDCLHHPEVPAQRMQDALEKMEEYNAWDYDAQVQEVTTSWTYLTWIENSVSFPGGQKKRILPGPASAGKSRPDHHG